ncbi:MAG: DNA integrity scanning protein DisA nucleotide-binding domain protein [Alistipes indistinctus]
MLVRIWPLSKTGALIVIGRSISLDPLIERGEPIDARVSSALIKTIFFKNSPLHDGAIVIANGRIAAARVCSLQPSAKLCLPEFGMRHRAALSASR